MTYNLQQIMSTAWRIFRKYSVDFREALHRAWLCAKAAPINAARIAAAKAEAEVIEETNTWSGWKDAGFEVRHGEKALFGCDLIWGSRGDGMFYKARLFGFSQVKPIDGRG